VVIWSKGEHPGYETKDVVGLLRFKKGAMTAVMKYDKGPN